MSYYFENRHTQQEGTPIFEGLAPYLSELDKKWQELRLQDIHVLGRTLTAQPQQPEFKGWFYNNGLSPYPTPGSYDLSASKVNQGHNTARVVGAQYLPAAQGIGRATLAITATR
jgi:hypothetical protein